MSEILKKIEKQIEECEFNKDIEEFEKILSHVNKILEKNYIVQPERKQLKKVIDHLHHLYYWRNKQGFSKEVGEILNAMAFELGYLLDHEVTPKKTKEILEKVQNLLKQKKDTELKEDSENIGIIIEFLQRLIDKETTFKPFIERLKFPIEISKPIKILFVESYPETLIIEYIDTKKFCIVVPILINYSEEDIRIEGFRIREKLSLTEIREFIDRKNEQTNHKYVYCETDTGSLLHLQCIPTNLREKYIQALQKSRKSEKKLKELLEWRRSIKCSMKLEQKFKEK